MKNLLLCILILLLSCDTSKKSQEYEVLETVNENTIDTDTLDIIIRGRDIEPEVLERRETYNSEYVEDNSRPPRITSPMEKIEIENKIDTVEILKKDINIGLIAYNIPDKFRVNEYSTITLRISRERKVESIVIGNRNIPIIDTSSNDKVVVESIEIDTLMKAKLHADEDVFEISLKSEYEQSISENGYTEWEWRVKPLRKGEHFIKLTVYISGKDLVVYDKKIPTDNNFYYSFTQFIKEWWEIISATIIIPIIIPLIKWFKRKKSE